MWCFAYAFNDLGCNNAAALLQGVATMKDVCNVVSDVFDSMFNATFPRNCHVKGLIEKELQFFLLHQELLKNLSEEDKQC